MSFSEGGTQLENTSLCYCCLDLCMTHSKVDKKSCVDMLDECYGIVMPMQGSGMCGVCRTSLRTALSFRRQVEHCSQLLMGQIVQKQSPANIKIEIAEDSMIMDIEEINQTNQNSAETNVCYDDNYENASELSKGNEINHDIDYNYENASEISKNNEINHDVDYNYENASEISKSNEITTYIDYEYIGDNYYGEFNNDDEVKHDDDIGGHKRKMEINIRLERDYSPIKIECSPKDRKPLNEDTDNSHRANDKIISKPKLKIKSKGKRDKVTPYVGNGKYSHNRLNMTKLLHSTTLIPFNIRSSIFICFYCGFTGDCYATMELLKKHMSETHKDITFLQVLSSCVRKGIQRISVEASDVMCKLCSNDLHYTTIEDLVDHLTEKHDIGFLESEIKPHDSIIPFILTDSNNVCYCCGESFQVFKTLLLHTNSHYGNHVCEICGKGFPMSGNLRTHMRTHIKNYVNCHLCSKRLDKRNLRNHIKFTHKRKYRCTFCDKHFKTQCLKLRHEIDVHGKHKNLPTTCEICGKVFPYNNLMRLHIKYVHLKQKSTKIFECNECGNRYSSKNSLRNHMYSHFDEKQFKCMICNRKLKTMPCLREHSKIHLDDLRWSCARCEQRFLAKISLKNHIASHHEGCGSELIVYTKPEHVPVVIVV